MHVVVMADGSESTSKMAGRRFPVMGTSGGVTVPIDHADQIDAVIERLERLEQTWSRFIPDSDISRLNAADGTPQVVSDDTVLLVELAEQAWCVTDGLFDPLMLLPLCDAGYDDDFARLPPDRAQPTTPHRLEHDGRHHCGRTDRSARPIVDRAARTVALPPGTGFDAGGIGKGLAADLAHEQLICNGVTSGVVDLGGDLRLWGPGPHSGRWHVGLPDRTIAVTDAGIATSGTQRRAWTMAGRRMHHLIDPVTARPSDTEIETASVVAATAWVADVLAVATLLTDPDAAREMSIDLGVEGVWVRAGGRSLATDTLLAD